MKTLASIAIGILAAYLTLGWVADHLDLVSKVACSDAFTLPDLACRFGGLFVTLLLVPLAGVVAFAVAWMLIPE